MHNANELIKIFNNCFLKKYNTVLKSGDDEPIYIPSSQDNSRHVIYFANGFFSSALHECAHWFIAGDMRRKLVDYGYWYAPDGRTKEQQEKFFKVEIKPQALEWIFSQATGYKFQFSVDNLSGEEFDLTKFKEDVYSQVITYQKNGLPLRAAAFLEQLLRRYESKGVAKPAFCDSF
ncbi:MAG: elongation factor P hydroxylase [Legionellaceae bacterium]|nr:elongation factor P hydroxylase [Legionellaceae bacterium]